MTAFKYKLRATGPITVDDYRAAAKRALPEMVWAYVENGAEQHVTLRANRTSFDRYLLRQQVLTGNEATDLTVKIGETPIALPVMLAPTGLTGLSHWTGERAAAQAAERAGTRAILSTAASYSIEEVAEATEENHFFQLYPWAWASNGDAGNYGLIGSLIQRAGKAGYAGLVVTVDVPVHGNREAERKKGMGVPPTLTPRRILSGALHPRWSYNFLRHQRISGRNLIESGGAKAAVSSMSVQYRMMRPELNWDDLRWVRANWSGPMLVKGILNPEDAETAVGIGVDGIIVSNHGGRQLDGAAASLDALPAIADRVARRTQILLDGGVRRGTDVVKAICLGADAVCIGRPYIYGLAARGGEGVEHVLQIFREEIARAMTLMGISRVSDLNRNCLIAQDDFARSVLARRS